ncbi:MAG: transcriptional repressor MprA [Methanocella sp. PtaU1.Bin125]|nr:MAG: transcriptional repressor MprA [Methanocella sp. PtaU1.Bin125]
MSNKNIDALVPALIMVQLVTKADRPSTWSASFEGLSPVDLHVLGIVERWPDVILREIKEYLDVPNSTLTGIVDRLESKGLIERVISNRDRRSYGLALTGRGRALREEQRQIRREAAARMLAALDSDAERDEFVRLMGKISDGISTEVKK